MNKIKYISIERGENFESSLTKLKRHLGSLNQYSAYDTPETLMGTFKILKLRRLDNINNISVKVDGPGFIIEKLFEFFRSEHERNEHSY